MLTEQEKDALREIICSCGIEGKASRLIRKRVTPQVLKEYSLKSDEEIREIISKYQAYKLDLLRQQKESLIKSLKEVNTKLGE